MIKLWVLAIIIILIFVLLSYYATGSSGNSCPSIKCPNCPSLDIDYYGGDIETAFKQQPSAGECQKYCAANKECKGWTYITGNKECWIKNKINASQPRQGAISGIM